MFADLYKTLRTGVVCPKLASQHLELPRRDLLAHKATHQLTAVESFFFELLEVIVGIGTDFAVVKRISDTVKWMKAFGF